MAYISVEYIESNGTYFRTGVVHQDNPKVFIDCVVVSACTIDSNNYLLGVSSPSYYSPGTVGLNAHTIRNNFSYYTGGQYNDYAGYYVYGNRYALTLDASNFIIQDKTEGTGTTVTVGGQGSATTQDYTIGAQNEILDGSGPGQNPSHIRIYEVIFYENNVEVAHYYPYGDPETGYGVLYDSISQNFITANDQTKTSFPEPPPIENIVIPDDLYVNGRKICLKENNLKCNGNGINKIYVNGEMIFRNLDN